MCYAFSEQVVSIGQLFTTFPPNSTRHVGPRGGETDLGRDRYVYGEGHFGLAQHWEM